MSFNASIGSRGKWMEPITEDVETDPVHGKNEQPPVVAIKPPTLPRSWTRFQHIQVLEEEEEAMNRSAEEKTEVRDDPLNIQGNAPKDVFETYRLHQFTHGTAHPSQVVTRDQLTFIMMYYMEIEQFYAAETVADDFVKNTIDAAIIAVAAGGEETFDSIDSDLYYGEPGDMIVEKMDELVKAQWEKEMDHFYRDQRDLCDIMC